ncbi:hypothetical protein [Sutterella sp.]|uniref:hypothetical protein n=1 Tax=Sutterella sp. TaxID=1981025 RepID=UPI0026E0004F|nr:hypothetical protein [Sutterella sp.]MDO5531144.1 hypothetical protein [Sutterella sp.]
MSSLQNGPTPLSMSENGTAVVSSRIPKELKEAADELARRDHIFLSHALRGYLEEALRRDSLVWWQPEDENGGAVFRDSSR